MFYGAGMNIKLSKKQKGTKKLHYSIYADTEIKCVYGCDGTLELRKIIK